MPQKQAPTSIGATFLSLEATERFATQPWMSTRSTSICTLEHMLITPSAKREPSLVCWHAVIHIYDDASGQDHLRNQDGNAYPAQERALCDSCRSARHRRLHDLQREPDNGQK